MKRFYQSGLLVSLLLAAGAGVAATSEEADRAIAAAEQELSVADQLGYTWRLIDPAAEGDGGEDVSADLATLLEIAKQKNVEGQSDEALRLAARVAEAARLGQDQAKQQADVKPYYN